MLIIILIGAACMFLASAVALFILVERKRNRDDGGDGPSPENSPDKSPDKGPGPSNDGDDDGEMITDGSAWMPDGSKNVILTVYTFQDNTPNNSVESASGRELKAYRSVAVPFRFLKKFGGNLSFGQNMQIKFLEGRKMPSGVLHNGWVTLDDFCGDNKKDSYCFQDCSLGKCANIDLFIGDFTASMTCDGGPGGNGTEETSVILGVAPPGALDVDYGVPASNGNKKCDYEKAYVQQPCYGNQNNC